MANIDTSEEALKQMLTDYPSVKEIASEVLEEWKGYGSDAERLFLRGFRLGVKTKRLAEEIDKNACYGYFTALMEKGLGIGRQNAFNYKRIAQHIRQNYECLDGLSFEDIDSKLNEESFLNGVLEEAKARFSYLKQSDYYKATLPSPPKKRVKPAIVELSDIDKKAMELSEIKAKFYTTSETFSFLFDKENRKNLDKIESVDLLRTKQHLEVAMNEIDYVLNHREELNKYNEQRGFYWSIRRQRKGKP